MSKVCQDGSPCRSTYWCSERDSCGREEIQVALNAARYLWLRDRLVGMKWTDCAFIEDLRGEETKYIDGEALDAAISCAISKAESTN